MSDDNRPTAAAFDALVKELVELREHSASVSNRLERIESCPQVAELVEAHERNAAALELAIAEDDAAVRARAASNAEIAEAITKRPWIGVFISINQPKGTTSVSIPLGGRLGTRDGKPGARILVERADDWAVYVKTHPSIATLIAAGEIEIRPLDGDQAIAAERNWRAQQPGGAAPRERVVHDAARRGAALMRGPK